MDPEFWDSLYILCVSTTNNIFNMFLEFIHDLRYSKRIFFSSNKSDITKSLPKAHLSYSFINLFSTEATLLKTILAAYTSPGFGDIYI